MTLSGQLLTMILSMSLEATKTKTKQNKPVQHCVVQ